MSSVMKSFKFVVGEANLADSPGAQAVRLAIGDAFGDGKAGLPLQCTEYVAYRVKTKLGVDIVWPVQSGRNGGAWGEIFKHYGTYTVSEVPVKNSAMCITQGISTDSEINAVGHVAFVERVLKDGSVQVSEANWPRDGIFNKRTISKDEWQNKYKAQFVRFV